MQPSQTLLTRLPVRYIACCDGLYTTHKHGTRRGASGDSEPAFYGERPPSSQRQRVWSSARSTRLREFTLVTSGCKRRRSNFVRQQVQIHACCTTSGRALFISAPAVPYSALTAFTAAKTVCCNDAAVMPDTISSKETGTRRRQQGRQPSRTLPGTNAIVNLAPFPQKSPERLHENIAGLQTIHTTPTLHRHTHQTPKPHIHTNG